MLAFVFPGQGSQKVGMGQQWYQQYAAFRDVFAEASASLGFDLAELCFDGPEDRLTATANAQPAIVACSIGVLRVLVQLGLRPDCVSGHSVGEFSALVCAGVVSLTDALRAVRRRGELMSGVRTPGTMVAIGGLSEERVSSLCSKVQHLGHVSIALYNSPQQIVVSGEIPAIVQLEQLAREAGAEQLTRLRVSQAFHSPLMAEIEAEWGAYLDGLPLQAASVPVVVNTRSGVCREPDEIRNALHAQLTSPVRWTQCVDTLARMGVQATVEVGDSRGLSSFIRMTDSGIHAVSFRDVGAVQQLVAGLVKYRATDPEHSA